LLDCLEAFYGGACGGGKVVSLEGLVLTPFGFRKGKDLKVGMAINNPDGSVARIIQIHPEYEYDEWIVKFHDGTQTIVTGGHLWLAWRSNKSRKVKNKRVFGVPSTEVVETATLLEWLETAKEQVKQGCIHINWPCIPICEEQPFNVTYKVRSDIDPYLLGVLLGDGSLGNKHIGITSGDIEHMKSVLAGYSYYFNGEMQFNFNGESRIFLQQQLSRLDLLGKHAATKFIPKEFLYSDIETRYAVVQGLMDTDGTVDDRGHLSYCTVSKQLAGDMSFLIRSLGGVVTVSEKDPFYRDEDGNKVFCKKAYNLYIKHREGWKLFRLPRKVERARLRAVTPMYKRVVDIELTGKKFRGRCISVSHPNGLYITDDFIVTHNSWALLAAALQYCDVPGYNALIVRDTYSNLSKPGSLIPVSHEWLQGTDAHWSGEKKVWTFPSGATLSFGHLDGPMDHFSYQSSAFQFVGLDEVVQLRKNQALYLFSRLRRDKEHSFVPIRFRAASNPPAAEQVATGSWVKVRYIDPMTKEKDAIFISAKMADNPPLDATEYNLALDKLDPVTRAQLKDGDWDIKAKGRLFQSEWFKIVSAMPEKAKRIRAWDLASTEKSKTNKDPDYTAGIRLAKTEDNLIYIEDMRKFRKKTKDTEDIIRQTAALDGISVPVWIEQEPGSSGKSIIAHYVRNILQGFVCKGERSTGSKISRIKPFASQAEAGNVFLIRGSWTKDFLDDIEIYPDGNHEDSIDALSLAYLRLVGGSVKARLRLI